MDQVDIIKISGWIIAALAGIVALLFRNGLLKRLDNVEHGVDNLRQENAEVSKTVARMEGKIEQILSRK